MFGKFGPAGHESLSNDPRNNFDKISNGLICNVHSNFNEFCKPPLVETKLMMIGNRIAATIPTAIIEAQASFNMRSKTTLIFVNSFERMT